MHFVPGVHRVEGFHREGERGKRRNARVLKKNLLRGGRSALHAVDHNNVGPRLHRQFHVIADAGRPHFDIDRHLPIGDLAELLQLDRQIVRADPVGMSAGRALIDSLRQCPHFGDACAHLLTEQHSATTGFGPLTDNDFDRVGLSQIVRIKSIP